MIAAVLRRCCAPVAAICLVLSGCSTLPTPTPSVMADRDLARDDQLIVLAVRNEPGATPPPAGSSGRRYDPTGYQVSATARRQMEALSHDYGLRKLAEWPISVLVLQCAVFEIAPGSDRSQLLARLQTDPRVSLAQPLQSFSTQIQEPAGQRAYGDLQSSLTQMSVPEAHRLATGRGVRVAVVDTGIDSSHPSLNGRVESEYNFVDSDSARFHADRHGTAVGGVIAATRAQGAGVSGVAPDARLVAMKACWQLQPGRDAARCNSFTLAQALAKAIELHPQIINLSLSGPSDPLLKELVDRAVREGIVVVGPGARNDASSFPAALPEVLRVVSSGSAQAVQGALRVPGEEVLSLVPGGGYDFLSGDSLAAAAVSGISALMLQQQPRIAAARLQKLFEDATVTRTAAGHPLRTIDACMALQRLSGASAGARCVAGD